MIVAIVIGMGGDMIHSLIDGVGKINAKTDGYTKDCKNYEQPFERDAFRNGIVLRGHGNGHFQQRVMSR